MNAVERARAALATAQLNERFAMESRQAGRITKSCHREHVRVRIECEQRLQDALRDATCEQCGQVFAGPTCVDCSDGD